MISLNRHYFTSDDITEEVSSNRRELLSEDVVANRRELPAGESGDPWREFHYNTELHPDGAYWLFWTPDTHTKQITFEVCTINLTIAEWGLF